MVVPNYTRLIPEHIAGKEITATESVDCTGRSEAIDLYTIARGRLLLVPEWQNLVGNIGAVFQLTDTEGNELQRPAKKEDYIRIDIPGPGSHAGEGYDWVRIEDIEESNSEDMDGIAMLVRPAANPRTQNNNIAHFYAEQSTSTFVVARQHNTVTASVYDRNIEANEETKQPLDKIRNAVVGIGAKHGFSKLQWGALVKGLLDN
jgi:hypothetical protein